MAEARHGFVEQTTAQTTTSTSYVDVTGAAIDAADLVDGDTYLIVIKAQINVNSSSNDIAMQTLHGSTPFAESEQVYEPQATAVYYTYAFPTVWTAVAGEGIKLQFKVAGSTGTADCITLFYLNLSDLSASDWKFAEVTTDSDLTTTPLDGASITVTPTDTHDWLIISYAQHTDNTITFSHESRINSAGTHTSTVPRKMIEGEDATNDIMGFFLERVYTGLSGEQTWKEQSFMEGSGTSGAGNDQRIYSSIFGLNLNAFRNHGQAYTEAETDLSGTDYATLMQSVSLTPDVAGDVWCGGFVDYDPDTSTNLTFKARLQVDDTDEPGGQTTDARSLDTPWDAGDTIPWAMQTVESLTAASHTVDLDGSVASPSVGIGVMHRLAYMVTMELPSAGGDPEFGLVGGKLIRGGMLLRGIAG